MAPYSIIIPIHNEERALPLLLSQIKTFANDHEIIFINDGSNDNSKRLLDSCNFINLISFSINLGKGTAIKEGIKVSKNERLIIYDGDLELKTDEIKRLMILNRKNDINFVLGSRFISKKRFNTFWDIGNLFITKIFNVLFDSQISDSLCCSKSFYKSDVSIKKLNSISFDIDVEITAQLINTKKEFTSVPLTYNRRTRSQGKKLGYWDAIKIINRLYFSYKSTKKII